MRGKPHASCRPPRLRRPFAGALTAAALAAPVLAAATLAFADAEVNPPSLYQPLPADRSRVDTAATLLRRVRAEPSSLNPILMFNAVDAEFDYLIWDRPIVLDAALHWCLNPAVAESYEEAPDHLSAVLQLRDGLTWQDGTPYTADDVVFSWQRIMDDRVVCRKARTGPDQLADCTAIGPTTVRFRFKAALPTNRWNVDFPILPKHLYAPVMAADPSLAGSAAAVRLNRNPVGNGPYRLAEWVDGERLVLERWPDYPGPAPAFARIVFQVIPDNHAALLAFETGQIDETPLTPQQFALETSGERFAKHGVKATGPGWTTYYIGWNVRGDVPFLADRRVREALSRAVNKPLIIERVFHGLFTPATGVFHPDSAVGDAGVEPYTFDLGRAGDLLDAAGWKRDPDDGWRYGTADQPDGTRRRVRAAFVLNLPQGSQTAPAIADIYQQDLRKLGVEITARTLEWAVFNERNFAGHFEAFLSAWTPGPDPDDAWNLFHASARDNGRNYTGYASAEADALLAKGRTTFDENERLEAYRAFARIVHHDAPYTFLVSAPTLWAFARDLHGVEISPRGPSLFFPGVRTWWENSSGKVRK